MIWKAFEGSIRRGRSMSVKAYIVKDDDDDDVRFGTMNTPNVPSTP
jgi:hypothetical protein